MLNKLPVVEIFGPTIQGEGDMCGKQTSFIRLGGCDYRCVMCDSLHAVIPQQWKKNATMMTENEAADAVIAKSGFAKWVTVSGGNPLMHELNTFIEHLHGCGMKVAVETQGTLWKDWIMKCDLITLSPKGPGMGEHTDMNEFAEYMKRIHNIKTDYPVYTARVCVKVVIFGPDDIEFAKEIQKIIQPYGVTLYLSLGNTRPPNNPDASDSSQDLRLELMNRYKAICDLLYIEEALAGAVFLPQLHVLAYGNDLGR